MGKARHGRTASNGQLFEARTFIVEGDGRFPFDMLRYDHCWPADETDSTKIGIPFFDATRRTVTLKTYSPNAPSNTRWESHFGWTVTHVHGVQVAPSKLSPQPQDHVA
jgi:hypothetical protein